MELKGKDVLVVGLARTGEALADFLLNRGARVRISEKKSENMLSQKVEHWRKRGVPVETGGHRLSSFLEANLIVPSPGVPPIPEIEEAQKRGIKVISEIELASYFLKGKIVAITGTNGKSTTATLIHKILQEGGIKSHLAGNIGKPLITFVQESADDEVYVTEVSSFQLEYIESFHAPLAIFLNLSQNHLDWHGTLEKYYQAKKKLFLNMKEGDTAVLNRDDPCVWALQKKAKFRVFGFSRKRRLRRGCFLEEGWIILSSEEKEPLLEISQIPLPGAHNLENVMASAMVAYLLGLPMSQLRQSIQTFQGLEHRLEKVATIKGIDFINDSKATTVDATLKALESFSQKIILILGGRDKGSDFRLLRRRVKEKVKKVLLLGEAKEKIRQALQGIVPMDEVSSLKEAVEQGFAEARPGEIILLAPACTSFDMFDDFEHRGRVFREEVWKLEKNICPGKN